MENNSSLFQLKAIKQTTEMHAQGSVLYFSHSCCQCLTSSVKYSICFRMYLEKENQEEEHPACSKLNRTSQEPAMPRLRSYMEELLMEQGPRWNRLGTTVPVTPQMIQERFIFNKLF